MPYLKVIVGLVVLVVLGLGIVGYSTFKTPAAASGPVTAIPLASGNAGAATADATAPAAASGTAAPAVAGTTAQPTGSTALSATSTGATTAVVFQIDQNQSQARFVVDEVLNGKPNTVVGSTNQVAGEISVDPRDPTKTRVGTIQVDARSLATDSGMRNRMIKNRILETDQNEFVTFTPSRLVGLPQQGTIGQSYTFQIVGNLKIRDVTKEVTFDVTAKAASATRLEGTAKTTIRYADYGISIPKVPQVASVGDQVRLELNFVAVPK